MTVHSATGAISRFATRLKLAIMLRPFSTLSEISHPDSGLIGFATSAK
jgi:hypothetical protein